MINFEVGGEHLDGGALHYPETVVLMVTGMLMAAKAMPSLLSSALFWI